jgi:PAS domain S-box-containing protein
MPQATYDKHSIVTTTTWIASIVAIAVALILPLGYFTLSYQYLVGSLETESEMTSSIITRLINANPEMWHFEQVRLEELLEQRKHSNHIETQRIFDLSGTLIAESNVGLRPPLVTRRFNLLEAGKIVGTLEINTSLRRILFNSGLIALFGVLCGALIFITLRTLPLRAVVAAEKSLRESEARYRLLVENAPDAILVYGRETILYANIAALRLFHAVTYDQLVGQSVTAICKSENHELDGKCLRLSDEASGASSQQEMQLTCLDGTTIQVIAVGISTIFRDEPAVQVILHDISERKKLLDELQDKVMLLEAARANVRHLEGIIPICMYCKKIRDDEESWQQMESYISQHSEALFSHGICPDCFPKAKSEAMKEWN